MNGNSYATYRMVPFPVTLSNFLTLVAGKRQSLLKAGDDDEVYDKPKPSLRRRQQTSI